MSNTIDVAFVKQYSDEVHVAYQRQGSKLRGSIRTKTISNAKDLTFQKYGTGTATTKGRHGLINVSDIVHTNVTATPIDYYFGEWIDDLDQLKTNIDERALATQAGAYTLGRKTDELIITALDSQTTNTVTLGVASIASFKNKILEAISKLNASDVPDDGNRWGVVSPHAWSWLMLIDEFVRSDYINYDNLPYKAGFMQVRNWAGVKWMQHSGLSGGAAGLATARINHLYHRSIAGHAIINEPSVDITWQGTRAAWFVAYSMSQGAVLIDGLGGCEMLLDETAALASS